MGGKHRNSEGQEGLCFGEDGPEMARGWQSKKTTERGMPDKILQRFSMCHSCHDSRLSTALRSSGNWSPLQPTSCLRFCPPGLSRILGSLRKNLLEKGPNSVNLPRFFHFCLVPPLQHN